MIQHHIQDCIPNHLSYQPGIFLPTRLIDLGAKNSLADPKLILTSQGTGDQSLRPEDVNYAALSYCWGPREDAATQLKTERESLAKRLQAIPPSEMSAVMKDAVAVCKVLDIRFLWIDSVCILQDNTEDWEKESEQMGLIYLCSFLTICAPASSSCHQGFLHRQNRKFDVAFRSGINPNITGTYTIEEQGLGSQLLDIDPHRCSPYNIDVGISSWGSRGWVYQEQKLAPRKLVFGRSMYHFVCPVQTISENGYELQLTVMESLIPVLQALQSRILSDEDVHMAWSEICCHYADLQLTEPLDRLPALSGLARLFAKYSEVTSDSYVAGIWKTHLMRGYGLLWQRRPFESRQNLLQRFRAPQPYIAPTWSWANQSGCFQFGYLHYHFTGVPTRPHSRVEYQQINAWTVCEGKNPFGRITEGTVRVTGRLTSFGPLRVSKRYPSTYARRIFAGVKYIADCALDWVTHEEGEKQDGLLLVPLLSTCAGTAPRLLIYSEIVDLDVVRAEKFDELHIPASDEYDFTRVLSERISEHENIGRKVRERPTSASNSACVAPPETNAYHCCKNERKDRDTFGIVLHPSDSPGKYWRVGVFLSEALRGGGAALFRASEYKEFEIV